MDEHKVVSMLVVSGQWVAFGELASFDVIMCGCTGRSVCLCMRCLHWSNLYVPPSGLHRWGCSACFFTSSGQKTSLACGKVSHQ